MMSHQIENYRAYGLFIQRCLSFTGLWPAVKNQSIHSRYMPIFSFLSGTVVTFALARFCWQNVANLSLLTKSMGLCASFSGVSLKILLFSIYRNELREVYYSLQDLFDTVLENQELRPTLLSLLRFFYPPAQVIPFTTFSVLFIYAIRPPIVIISQLINGVTPEAYPICYPASYFWTIKTSKVFYSLHYTFETLFGCIVLSVTGGVDTFLGYFVFQMSGLMRALSFEFQHMKNSEDRKEFLHKCIIIHSQFIQFSKILQKVYGPIVLHMAVTNAIIMCSSIFQIVESDAITIGAVVQAIIYTVLKVAQTFMYALYGQVITTESETFVEKVYCSNWYENRDRTFQRGIILLLMQRPIRLTACHFFSISLDFFQRILYTTLSYFFLLQTLDDSE